MNCTKKEVHDAILKIAEQVKLEKQFKFLIDGYTPLPNLVK